MIATYANRFGVSAGPQMLKIECQADTVPGVTVYMPLDAAMELKRVLEEVLAKVAAIPRQ